MFRNTTAKFFAIAIVMALGNATGAFAKCGEKPSVQTKMQTKTRLLAKTEMSAETNSVHLSPAASPSVVLRLRTTAANAMFVRLPG